MHRKKVTLSTMYLALVGGNLLVGIVFQTASAAPRTAARIKNTRRFGSLSQNNMKRSADMLRNTPKRRMRKRGIHLRHLP